MLLMISWWWCAAKWKQLLLQFVDTFFSRRFAFTLRTHPGFELCRLVGPNLNILVCVTGVHSNGAKTQQKLFFASMCSIPEDFNGCGGLVWCGNWVAMLPWFILLWGVAPCKMQLLVCHVYNVYKLRVKWQIWCKRGFFSSLPLWLSACRNKTEAVSLLQPPSPSGQSAT